VNEIVHAPNTVSNLEFLGQSGAGEGKKGDLIRKKLTQKKKLLSEVPGGPVADQFLHHERART